MMSSRAEKPVRIVELKDVPPGAIMVNGLPGVGLVGVIAVSHIVRMLKLQEVAYVDSPLLPPITVLHGGLPHAPIRIHGNHELLAVLSEIPIPSTAVYTLSRSLVDWAAEKKVKMIVSLGGIAVPNRGEIEQPATFAVASDEDSLKLLKETGVKIMEEGYMVGPYAVIMAYARQVGVPSISILAESFFNYPDPEAAAATITVLNKLVGVDVEVSELIERGEEIRLRARDMMKRTQEELMKMKSDRELDIPPPIYI